MKDQFIQKKMRSGKKQIVKSPTQANNQQQIIKIENLKEQSPLKPIREDDFTDKL